jgi:hypothetical protein
VRLVYLGNPTRVVVGCCSRAIWESGSCWLLRALMGVVFDELREQMLELSAIGRRKWREERLLGGLDLVVEAFQCAGSGRSEIDKHSTAVVLIADASNMATLLEVAEQSVHLASVDP